jgi:tol-pal system protein YbgF
LVVSTINVPILASMKRGPDKRGEPVVRQVVSKGITSVSIRAFLLTSFLFACITSCASQKDVVHLNNRINALYRQTKEDEEIRKKHEDAQWELSGAIDELEWKQSELERQLKTIQEIQESARTQLGEALKVRDAEQEAERRKSLGTVMEDLDSIRATIAQLQADLLGAKENIQVLTGQIEESNYLIRGVIERDTTKTDAMVSQLNEFSLVTEDFRSRLEVLENYVSSEIEAKRQRALLEKSSPLEQRKEAGALVPQRRELTESELYDRALGYHRDGRHQEAMADFNNFLKLYPKSDLADNAQFWIGEGYRAQGKNEEAILAYQKVINGYPGGNKVPAALLQQGFAFDTIGDTTTAELVFKKLVKNFPKTSEAEIARKRLQETQ